jgi:hypothetical protein
VAATRLRLLRTLFLILCLGPGLVLAQHSHEHDAPKGPTLGIIDFYGIRDVPEDEVRAALGVTEGEVLPSSKNDAEMAIEEISGIVLARMQAVCCDEGKAILYVGIEERGAPHFDYRLPPADPVLLPAPIHENYVLFLSALNEAVREGQTKEDLTRGHSLMENAAARSYQEKFVELADENLAVIQDVLRNSLNQEHRAIAAYVIGYASDKKSVVDDLLYSLRDPDDTVRSNSMRALAAIEVHAKLRPTLGITIPPTWLVEMLNSIIWTDRTTAAVNLVNLTEWRKEAVLEQLEERALDSLLDMARWRHLPHALPAYILLGRLLKMEEEAIQEAWSSDDRLELVEEAAALREKSK